MAVEVRWVRGVVEEVLPSMQGILVAPGVLAALRNRDH
jgi:hypothetical protein